MSHFAVMVLGENPDKQLQPYHEYECTGIDDEYVIAIEEGYSLWKDFERYKSDDESFLSYLQRDGYLGFPQAGFDPNAMSNYVFYSYDRGGRVVDVYRRTNPNAKWDWWVEGGRWSGLLLNESGERVDCARLCEIDLESMRNEKAAEALARYDKMMTIIAGRPWKRWSTVLEQCGGDLDRARAQYEAQSVVIDARKDDPFCEVDDFHANDPHGATREEWETRARRDALVTFAVVKEGKWYERGKMGWWAMVTDEMDDSVWASQVAELLDNSPPDTLVTIVDCHI